MEDKVIQDFLNHNLANCAEEIIEWDETTVLPDGKLVELAKLLKSVCGYETNYKLARRVVEKDALRYVVYDLLM